MIEAARDAHHHAELTPNTVKAILQYTALPMPGYDQLTQGTGSLNAAGAIELATKIDPTMAIGSYWLDFAPSGSTASSNSASGEWL